MSQITTAILAGFNTNYRVHGEQATYRAGNQSVVNLDVIPGKSAAETIDPATLLATNIDLQDFHIRAADLVWPGQSQPFRPERGHIIEVVRDGQVQQFTVNHPNGNQAPFRRADAYGAVLRVHTIEMQAPVPVSE